MMQSPTDTTHATCQSPQGAPFFDELAPLRGFLRTLKTAKKGDFWVKKCSKKRILAPQKGGKNPLF